MIKIQSFSDVITNSSSSVFIVYTESNIKSIKTLVDAVLAIDGNYTFDDLFDIYMSINSDIFDNAVFDDEFSDIVEIFYDRSLNYQQANIKACKLLESFPSEKKKRFIDLMWDCVDEDDYESCCKSPYDGIIIMPKTDSEEVKRACNALNRLSDIFDIDFCYG